MPKRRNNRESRLQQLCSHSIPAVRRWAREQLRYAKTQIEQEKARDDEHAISIF